MQSFKCNFNVCNNSIPRNFLRICVINFLKKLIDKIWNLSVWNFVPISICCTSIFEIIFQLIAQSPNIFPWSSIIYHNCSQFRIFVVTFYLLTVLLFPDKFSEWRRCLKWRKVISRLIWSLYHGPNRKVDGAYTLRLLYSLKKERISW